MRIFAPAYFNDFKCIADMCPRSCCVGWEICVDRKTLKKYESLTEGYGERIRESVDYTDEPHFSLSEGRCPHLDERGLCRIITECSEEYLSDICRLHPRFFNYTARGCEAGLGMSCPEAARIILTSDRYADIEEIGRDRRRVTAEFDTSPYIDALYRILSDASLSYSERIARIKEKFSIEEYDTESVRMTLSTLEYKDALGRSLILSYSGACLLPSRYDAYLERALAYFVYRHASECEGAEEISRYFAFAIFLCDLLSHILSSDAVLRELRDKNDEGEEKRIFLLASILSDEIEYSTDNTETLLSEFLF